MHVCTSAHAVCMYVPAMLVGVHSRRARSPHYSHPQPPAPHSEPAPHPHQHPRPRPRAQSSPNFARLWTLLHHAGRRGATREQPVVGSTNKPAREDPSGRKRRSAGDKGGEGDKGSPHSSKNLCVTKLFLRTFDRSSLCRNNAHQITTRPRK